MRQKICLISLFIAIIALSACSTQREVEDGKAARGAVLYGSVMIGPVCPVEIQGEDCKPTPEMYEARDIIIKDMQGNMIRTVDIGPDGTYRIGLDPGTYMVDMARTGVDSSPDIPTQVTLAEGDERQLDIGIDTGIR